MKKYFLRAYEGFNWVSKGNPAAWYIVPEENHDKWIEIANKLYDLEYKFDDKDNPVDDETSNELDGKIEQLFQQMDDLSFQIFNDTDVIEIRVDDQEFKRVRDIRLEIQPELQGMSKLYTEPFNWPINERVEHQQG